MLEILGWLGEYEITIRHRDGREERQTVKNRITNAGLNLLRDALLGVASDCKIKYLAFGTYAAALNDADTKLGAEGFRTPFVTINAGGTGVVQSAALLLDSEGVMQIREIGVFAGSDASAAPNTGVMISRILWTRDKTNLESIQFSRTDTIGRG